MDAENLREGFEAKDLATHSILTIRCHDKVTNQASCTEIVTLANGITITIHKGKDSYCKIENSGEVLLYLDFNDESNPKNINKSSFVCISQDFVGRL